MSKIQALWHLSNADPRLSRWTRDLKVLRLYGKGGYADKPFATGVSAQKTLSEFIDKNSAYMSDQNQLGMSFYNYAYVYLPSLEIDSNHKNAILPSQYGYGSSYIYSWVMSHVTGVTFQGFSKIYWYEFVIYCALLLAASAYIGGWWGAIIGGVVCEIGLLLTGGYALQFAPGYNPARHLPEIFAFVFLYLDYRYHRRWTFVLRVAAIALFLWWNKQFGLFFFAGSIAWRLVLIAVGERLRWRDVVELVAEVAVGGMVLFWLPASEGNGLQYYTLMGLSVAPVSGGVLAAWLAVWSILLVAPLRRLAMPAEGGAAGGPLRDARLNMAGAGFLYCAMASLYAIWNPSPEHVAAVILCATLPLVALVTTAMGSVAKEATAFIVLALAPALVPMAQSHSALQRVFHDHELFEWSFPGFHGKVTADPAPVAASLALIDKVQPAGRLYLLSRFDGMLDIVGNRLPALPYIDLKSAVVSHQMVDRVVAEIEAAKPPVIFVDRDLWAPRADEIVWSTSANSKTETKPDSTMLMRVGQLTALGMVGHELAACYTPGRAQGLLRVWRRTCGEGG